MAIKGAVRWKPDTYRSSIEATVMELDPSVTPPGGSVVLIIQAIAYDDTVVTPANYQAGHPDTERNIIVLHEQVKQYALSAAHSMTTAAINSFLAGELVAYKNWVLPAGPALIKAFYGARTTAPLLVE
jgi:hypothetical protein